MPTIVTDISKPLEWIARKAQAAALTIRCTLNASAFDLSDYDFTAELFRVGSTVPTVSLTESSGITNGGSSGVLNINYTPTQLDIIPDSYRWYLKAVHPDGFTYQWLNAPFTLNGELYDGSSSQEADVTIDLGDITLELAITLTGGGGGSGDIDGGSSSSIYTENQTIDLGGA